MAVPVDQRTMIQRLVTGQASAWREFVARYQPLVFSRVQSTAVHCQFQLDAAELEDICADVFASLIENDYRSLRQFREQCRLSTWLGVIARRVCLRALTKLRDARHANQALPELDGAGKSTDQLAELIHMEQRAALGETVKQLNENDRLLINLYFHEELSYAEISQRAGISTNSVGPKLHRAVSRLKKLMGRA